MIDLSIIIVNWNVEDLLEQCLSSIFQTNHSVPFEVIVVDNHSSTKKIKEIKAKFNKIQLIENMKNLGFAKANNQAIRISRGKNILFLNPDTIVMKSALYKMYKYIGEHKTIGAIGPKIINEDDSLQKQCIRNYPNLIHEFIQLMRMDRFFPKILKFSSIQNNPIDYNKTQEARVLSGSCMLVRKTVLDEINGFDEAFFLYSEDVDLCRRISEYGWDIHYCPEAVVKHLAHKSSEKSTIFSPHAISVWSMYLYFKKHHGKSSSFVYRLIVTLTSSFWVIIHILTLQFFKKRPINRSSLYHDYYKLMWALTSKIKLPE